MKVLGRYVLVEQIATKKSMKILISDVSDEKEKFDFHYKILKVGADCKYNLKKGDIPIFSQHVTFQNVKVLEKTDDRLVVNIVVYEEDIIAIEN